MTDANGRATGPNEGPGPTAKLKADMFGQFAAWTTRMTGSKWALLAATMTIVVWAVTGPFFRYSDTWQLVINTGTTIVTFLMVFLIQNSQNRESKAVHLKLDELIRAHKPARNELIDVESLSEEQLEKLAERYRRLAAKHHEKLASDLDAEPLPGQVERVEEKVEQVEQTVGRVEEKVEHIERHVHSGGD